MTHNPGISLHDKIQIRQWADERTAQDAAGVSAEQSAWGTQPDAEWSDDGRDLEHFPRGWWLKWIVFGGLLCIIGAAWGIVAVAQVMR